MLLNKKPNQEISFDKVLPINSEKNLEKPSISLNKIKNNKFNKKYILLGVIIILIISLIGVGAFYYINFNQNNDNDIANDDTNVVITSTPIPTPEPIFYPNPLTGELIPEADYIAIKEKPFVAAMIQNNTESRPEYGLNEAEIVYETLVEAGITRFMGVYWQEDSPKIQSIRSARKYFVDLLGDLNDPAYLHIGYAQTNDPKTNALGAMNNYGINRIGELTNTITGERAYSRDSACERVKAVEHCAYSDSKRLFEIAQQQNWKNNLDNYEIWDFVEDKDLSKNGTDLLDFTVNFNYYANYHDKNYSVRWKYDPINEVYLRFNNDNTPYVDGFGKQVQSETLIYQKVVSAPSYLGDGRQAQAVIGSGDGYVMMKGKVYPILWSKPSFEKRTTITDIEGKPFKFQRGKMWIMITGDWFDYIKNDAFVPTITQSIN